MHEICPTPLELNTFRRPHYVVFPHDKSGFAIDDQYYIGGSGLLVKPITQKDVIEASVYIAEDEVHFLNAIRRNVPLMNALSRYTTTTSLTTHTAGTPKVNTSLFLPRSIRFLSSSVVDPSSRPGNAPGGHPRL